MMTLKRIRPGWIITLQTTKKNLKARIKCGIPAKNLKFPIRDKLQKSTKPDSGKIRFDREEGHQEDQ